MLIIICICVDPLWEVFIIEEHDKRQGVGCEFREYGRSVFMDMNMIVVRVEKPPRQESF